MTYTVRVYRSFLDNRAATEYGCLAYDDELVAEHTFATRTAAVDFAQSIDKPHYHTELRNW